MTNPLAPHETPEILLPFGTMTDLAADVKLGPAMKHLTPKARAFVMALVELGGVGHDRAALMAGYKGNKSSLGVMGSRLASDPKVQEAIVEEAKALARSSALAAVATTIQVMTDVAANKQVRLNAAARIMALASLEPEKVSTVKHEVSVSQTTKEQVDAVVRLAQEVGIDPRKLLGRAGVTVDAEYTIVGDSTGLEDLL